MYLLQEEVSKGDEISEDKDRCPGCNKVYNPETEDHVQYTKLSCGHSLCAKVCKFNSLHYYVWQREP